MKETKMDNNWKEVEFDDLRDPVVGRVIDKFKKRSDVGFKKYGQTLDNERRTGVKDLAAYLNDIQEELMDAILYIQAAREELVDKPYCKCEVKDVGLPYYVTDVAT
jgi:hypothetical protein